MSEATKASPGWRAATDFEFSYRAWIFAVIFFGSFQLYMVDHVAMAVACAGWLQRIAIPATPRLVEWGGVALVAAAALLRTWAAAYMRSDVVHDTQVHDTRLVADGPYRYMRNPLYMGTTLMGLGLGLMASRLGFFVLIAALIVFHDRLVLREEHALRATQGAGYRQYLERVPRFLPSLAPRVPSGGMRPRWGQAFVGEIAMWAFAAAYALYVLTRDVRLLTWSSLAIVAVILLMRGSWLRLLQARQ